MTVEITYHELVEMIPVDVNPVQITAGKRAQDFARPPAVDFDRPRAGLGLESRTDGLIYPVDAGLVELQSVSVPSLLVFLSRLVLPGIDQVQSARLSRSQDFRSEIALPHADLRTHRVLRKQLQEELAA